MNKHYFVAIMAGGVGSRFWPGSREAKPKQFLDMLGTGKTLLQMTYERHLPLCPPENIFVVTNAAYRDLVKAQLPALTDNQILCEPSRNNTAPCVAYTAFKLAGLDPNGAMVVAPSDHIILKNDAYLAKLERALEYATTHDALGTLGIQPTRPDTGYGYIHYDESADNGVHRVKRFAEKPDRATAEQFVASGEYLWNAGIFIWSTNTILKAFEQYAGDIYTMLEQGTPFYNTAEEQAFINETYPKTPNISVDFAIMEKATQVFTLPADVDWSDLGTWASLHEECEKDDAGNALQVEHHLMMDASNNLVRSSAQHKLIVIKDLDNYIIVDEDDVLMIYPKSKEQEIKQVTAAVKDKFKGAFL